jgi:hypothetical protein
MRQALVKRITDELGKVKTQVPDVRRNAACS